jgi:hypothetical protein
VQQEWITKSYLASTFVGSPDERQKSPPYGQKILISWDFPLNLFEENLSVTAAVRLYNLEEKIFTHKVQRKRGWKTYYFANPNQSTDLDILTYKVEVRNNEGKIIETWEHPLWTNPIQITQESV